MTQVNARRVRSLRTMRVRRLLRPRVCLGFELAALAAWITLAALTAAAGTHGAHGAPHTHAAAGPKTAAPMDLAMWTLMSVAMMLPSAVPELDHVGTNSLRRRRQRAMATFAAAYLAVWIGYGALLLHLAPLWSPLPGKAVLASALALAAVWQLTVHKRRALRDCHRSSPLPLSGWPAVAGATRYGLRHGGACLRSCWALMLVMAVAGGAAGGIGMLGWTVLLTGIVTTEKLARRPRRPTHVAAAVLAAAAVTAALTAGLA
ncbi:DUF2182 domain-containing protein [Streptomyces spororaveus]|uniref:copper chaperone n=1 Tax=Streptomyces spororaveus TaxID=284039 RepID=UPI003699D3D5